MKGKAKEWFAAASRFYPEEPGRRDGKVKVQICGECVTDIQ